MTLPAPNLDDRGFQDLVDEAKRLVQLRNPNWTDHNVSDPGVTLIETFAYMVDQLIYRLNRVPDLHYVKFLDLLGERMIPPSAAMTNIEFWLSVATDVDMDIPLGTQVSTARLGAELPVTFSTMEDLHIPAISCTSLLTRTVDGTFESPAEMMAVRKEFPTFSDVPQVGDSLYIGLSAPASRCFVRLTVGQIDTDEGIGVDPNNPPYIVQAWDGEEWVSARIVRDDTGGLNRENSMDVYVAKHAVSSIGGESAAWLRISIVETTGRQPAYVRTPVIKDVLAETVGGVALAAHSEIVENDLIGPCSGVPGDRIQLSQAPLVAGQSGLVIEVSSPDGWQAWTRVESFADSGPEDSHFTLDEVSGEIRFGPLIRQPDGSVRAYGSTPTPQAMVRVPRYFVGGGRAGNVDSRTLTVLRSSIPFVSEVVNPVAATGGHDAETIDDVKDRAAITVRTQMRAVTARDYELLVKLAAPSIARVVCSDANTLDRPGHVLIQIVPRVPRDLPDFQALMPTADVLEEIRSFIDERRPLGSIVHIEPPKYLGVAIAARIALKPGAQRDVVLAQADAALRHFMHPVEGGLDGQGWPFGHPVLTGDIHAVLQKVPGLAYVDVVRLTPVDIVKGTRGKPKEKIQPEPRDLVYCVGTNLEVMA